MGTYLNPTSRQFQKARNTDIYVDKSGLISYTNKVLDTLKCYVCLSCPRRFGKTTNAEMLIAYYSRGCQSHELFCDLAIAQDPTYETHRNKYNVIFINTKRLFAPERTAQEMIAELTERIIDELQEECPQITFTKTDDLVYCLDKTYKITGIPYVFIIDEWDCLVREVSHKASLQEFEMKRSHDYLRFLETMFKGKDYVALAYLTGILPTRKYGTQSSLNMFTEFSMTSPKNLANFMGFTEDEVQNLCQKYDCDFTLMKQWYDGYTLGDLHIYNPLSVVSAISFKNYESYWNTTESFDSLLQWIEMNLNGLHDAIVRMLGGQEQEVDIRRFTNTFSEINDFDDVLTLLIHLGYLTYNPDTKTARIPNYEITDQFEASMSQKTWGEVYYALRASEELLKNTWNGDQEAVAQSLDSTYFEESILTYNNENSMACRLSLAYYTAKKYYTVVKEMPAGKGFADIAFVPKPQYSEKPALVIELKWNQNADTAIAQIKRQEYHQALQTYKGNMLLVGISYDKATKKHACVIERA